MIRNLAIVIIFLKWKQYTFLFMEDFMQTNVFAWMCIIFAHLIIGRTIWYLIIGN